MSEERIHGFYAFHGAPESCAKAIITDNVFTSTLRPDHWLGQGAYFYREDEEQAFVWASVKVKNDPKFKGENPSVIEVFLESKNTNFLNLDTRAGLLRLYSYLQLFNDEGLLITANSDIADLPAKLRCYLLSLLPDEIWMIQRTFKVERSIFDYSELFVAMELSLLGTQICVRNHNVIKEGSMKVLGTRTAKKLARSDFESLKMEKSDS